MWFSTLLSGSGILLGGFISRTNSDITTTGWTASSGSVLNSMINETTPNDTNSIISPSSSLDPVIFGISPVLVAGSYDINIRTKKISSTASIRVLLLDVSSSIVGTSDWQATTDTAISYTLPVVTTGIATQIKIEVQ